MKLESCQNFPNWSSLAARRAIRQAAGCVDFGDLRLPIEIDDSDDPPYVYGEGGYHTTPSGKTIVRHPNAYGYRTFYHPSTRRVVVGREWLRGLGAPSNPCAFGE